MSASIASVGDVPDSKTDRPNGDSMAQSVPSQDDKQSEKAVGGGQNALSTTNEGGNLNRSPTTQDPKPQTTLNQDLEEDENSCSGAAVRDSVKLRNGERESRTDFKDLDQAAPPILKNRGNLFLKKRGPFAKWKLCFVVVDEKQFQMSFYKSAEEYENLASCKTAIDLRFVERVVPIKSGLLKSNFPFKLFRRAGLSTVKVACDTEEERAKWINTLEDLVHKIRQSPERDSSSESQRPATLPRGVSVASETQTSDSEIMATSAPEEDFQIRPKKPSKQGMKLDPRQLSSIKLKRIDSEKEEIKEREPPEDKESFDPEQKFGVQLRRISSERRSSPPKSPDNEQVTEFKIKFNSLKRTKAPIIPMSNTLRNTVGDITKQDRLTTSPSQPKRKTPEAPRKRSPSPNIPISDSVKSVMKKPDQHDDEVNAIGEGKKEKKESKICHATTTELPQFDFQPLELDQSKNEIHRQNNIQAQIRKNINKREEQIEELRPFCDDGKEDFIAKKEVKKTISLPLSSHIGENADEDHASSDATNANINRDSAPLAKPDDIKSQVSSSDTKSDNKRVHRSFSSITITTSARKSNDASKLESVDTHENDTAISTNNASLKEVKESPEVEITKKISEGSTHSEQGSGTFYHIETVESTNELNKSEDEKQRSDLLNKESNSIRVVEESENGSTLKKDEMPKQKSIDSNIAPLSDSVIPSHDGQQNSTTSSSVTTIDVTIAEIKSIEPKEEMQTSELKDINDIQSDNIKDFMAQMIDKQIPLKQTEKSEKNMNLNDSVNLMGDIPDLIPESKTDKSEACISVKESESNDNSLKDEEQDKKKKESSPFKVSCLSRIETDTPKESREEKKFENLGEIQIPMKTNIETGQNENSEPVKRQSKAPLYKMFNTLDSDQESNEQKAKKDEAKLPITKLEDTGITIEVVESERTQKIPMEVTANDYKNVDWVPSVITREEHLSVEDQQSKRPSDLSLGSSECDEPLPRFCFLGTNDRSSTGSAVLKSIISAAEEELKKLPVVEVSKSDHNQENKGTKNLKVICSHTSSIQQKLPNEEIENSRKASQKEDKNNIKPPEVSDEPNKLKNNESHVHQHIQDLKDEATGDSDLREHLKGDETSLKVNTNKANRQEKHLQDVEDRSDLEESSDYFPSFSPVEYRVTTSTTLSVEEPSSALRTSGINGLKAYLSEEEEQTDTENIRGAAISRLGHSVAIEKLRDETT